MVEDQLVLFRIGSEEYAISITQVKEIILYQGATEFSNIPEYIEGIISLRGKRIPMIDLALRLGLAAAQSEDRWALIIETAGRDIGMVVDDVTEVIPFQNHAIEPPTTALRQNEYIRGIAKAGSRLLILLEVNKLFSEEELQELKKVG